jgi:hypothetical protein
MIKRLRVVELIFQLSPSDYQKNSRESGRYNCIAFAAGDTEHFWDGFGDPPDGYWPTPNTGHRIDCLISAYEAEGFELCTTPDAEAGYEKIALYADARDLWTHAARLREDGWWESKLGRSEDIIHRTTDCLEGRFYGMVVAHMKRPVSHRIRFHLVRWVRASGDRLLTARPASLAGLDAEAIVHRLLSGRTRP